MLKTWLNRISQNNFDVILDNILMSDIVAEAIKQYQTKQIYNQGIDKDGNRITNYYSIHPVYSPKYTKEKREAGLYQGFVDLSWSGKFLKTLQVEYDAQKLNIYFEGYLIDDENFDNLADKLRRFYGAEIEGLTNENFEKLCKEIILPLLQEEFLEELKRIFQM